MYLRSSIRILRQCILRFLSRLFATPFRGSLGPYLIVAPHPDDEVLGCGGLIAQTVALTGRVYIVFLTGGESSHDACCNLDRKAIKDARRGLFADAGRHLSIQVENVVFLDWGDGKIGREGHGESINNINDLLDRFANLGPLRCLRRIHSKAGQIMKRLNESRGRRSRGLVSLANFFTTASGSGSACHCGRPFGLIGVGLDSSTSRTYMTESGLRWMCI